MKTPSLVVLMGLALAACTDNQSPAADPVQPEADAAVAVDESPVQAPAPVAVVMPSAGRPAEIPASLGTTEGCSLDAVNGQSIVDTAIVADKEHVQLGGWAGDLTVGTSPEQVFVQLEGPETIFIEASRGTKRPDVAAQYGHPGLEDAGWDANANLAEVAAGTYRVSIIQVDGDAGVSCETKRSIVLN